MVLKRWSYTVGFRGFLRFGQDPENDDSLKKHERMINIQVYLRD